MCQGPLQQNQRDANEDGADGGENVVDEIVLGKFQTRGAFAFEVEEPGEIENHGELGNFGGLNADGTETNPAMRGVRLIEEERADKHEHDKAEHTVDDNRLAQLPVIHAHQSEHSRDAENEPDGLAQNKNSRSDRNRARR